MRKRKTPGEKVDIETEKNKELDKKIKILEEEKRHLEEVRKLVEESMELKRAAMEAQQKLRVAESELTMKKRKLIYIHSREREVNFNIASISRFEEVLRRENPAESALPFVDPITLDLIPEDDKVIVQTPCCSNIFHKESFVELFTNPPHINGPFCPCCRAELYYGIQADGFLMPTPKFTYPPPSRPLPSPPAPLPPVVHAGNRIMINPDLLEDIPTPPSE